MLEAYLDEGGTDDKAKIVVMTGLLASYRTWSKFDGKWNKILNPDGGNLVFHATDCMGKEGYKQFAGWSKERRNKLVDELVPIVKRHTRASVSCAFSRQDYEEVVPDWIKQKWKHPYYLCMFHIMNVLQVNRSKLPLAGEKISFVFAHKPKFSGLLTDLYDTLKYRTNKFPDLLGKMTVHGSPEEDIPVQAADLLCYLVRTFFEKDYFVRDSAHPRTVALLNALRLRNHLQPEYLNRDTLKMFVRTYEDTYDQVGDWEWGAPSPRRD